VLLRHRDTFNSIRRDRPADIMRIVVRMKFEGAASSRRFERFEKSESMFNHFSDKYPSNPMKRIL
jgi:hypothetical protein